MPVVFHLVLPTHLLQLIEAENLNVFDPKQAKDVFFEKGHVIFLKERTDPHTVAQNWKSPKSKNDFSPI